MAAKKRRKRRKAKRKPLGFTNWLAVCLMLLLAAGLAGGYRLAVLSIHAQYSGSLLCWTVVFTPIGTALSFVLGKVVEKNKQENTDSDGKGIVFAAAEAQGFSSVDSPEI